MRLIPAHAGKTAVASAATHGVAAHPRSRGENRFHDRCRGNANGSSPLTRGKHPVGGADSGRLWLIPAHAGKTEASHTPRRTPGAHPRSRGENVRITDDLNQGHGSSPLTRGKRSLASRVGCQARLIPAHAGKTPQRSRAARPGEAHPRSRGENFCIGCAHRAEQGSSPLTRGKPCSLFPVPGVSRLIPAHAGKTPQSR